jgi:ferredoxin-type protein NapH
MIWEVPTSIALPVYVLAVAAGIILIIKLSKDKTKKISYLRMFIQIAAVVAVFMGLILGPFNQLTWLPLGPSPRDRLFAAPLLGYQLPDGIPFPILACYYPNGRTVTCVIWQLQANIFPFWNYPRGYEVLYSTTGLERIGILVGVLVTMSVFLGRSMCGWLCPFGLYQDALTRLRKALHLKHLSVSDSTSKKLSQARYVIIAIILILSVIFGSYYIFGVQIVPGTRAGGPQGAEAGIVSFINEPYCLICPMRPLCCLVQSGIGSINYSYISQITYGPLWVLGSYVTSINLAILVVVTLLAFVYRRVWCRICPVGALTAFFSTHTPFNKIALMRLEKNQHKCTRCGVCRRACPTQAKKMYDAKGGDVTESKCTLCARCVELCPYEDALKLTFAGKTLAKSRNWLQDGRYGAAD